MTHNKTWYNNRIAEMKWHLEHLQAFIAIATAECKTEEQNDALNGLHDSEYEMAQTIKNLEHQRDTRNWNHQDWTLHNMIAQNID